MGCCTWLLWLAAVDTAALLLLALLPGLPPHCDYPVIEQSKSMPLTGLLEPNNVLDGTKRLLEGQIKGPEGLASRRPGELFVSTATGHIVKLSGKNLNKMEIVAQTGKECQPLQHEECGRPLGIRFARDGQLLVADVFRGILKVNVDTGAVKQIVDPKVSGEGAVAANNNDVVEDSSGNLYWSVTSTWGKLSDLSVLVAGSPSGRLMKHDAKTGANSVLLEGLFFANGVELSPNEDFILVCEIMAYRVTRYWLKGPKAGTRDTFIEELPGPPDNIRARPGGGYDLPLVSLQTRDGTGFAAAMGRLPWLRRLLSRLVYLIEGALSLEKSLFSSNCIAEAMKKNELSSIESLYGNSTVLMQLDADGRVVSSLHGDNGHTRFMSQVITVGDTLYFGSFIDSCISAMDAGEATTAATRVSAGGKQAKSGSETGGKNRHEL